MAGQEPKLPPLLRLSTELGLQIVDHVPPSSHWDFACTCKQVASWSADILKRHRKAHRDYKVSSDLLPETVITLLRSLCSFSDPIAAWHVRSFEVWYDRQTWAEWKPLRFDVPIGYDRTPSTYKDMDFMSWTELSAFLNPLRRFFYSEESSPLHHTYDGSDSALKACLLATLPRLRDIKFVAPYWNHEDGNPKMTLGWLKDLIQMNFALEYQSRSNSDVYPISLQNLNSVAIGVRSATWMDAFRSNDNASLLARFMSLPNIESIYMSNALGGFGQMEFCDFLSPGSSSLKHLFLDNASSMCNGIFAAPRDLRTASFRATGRFSEARPLSSVGDNIRTLLDYQSKSLEALMFYGYHEDDMHNYYNHRRMDSYFPLLKHFSVDIDYLRSDSEHSEDKFRHPEDETDHDRFARYFVTCFPHSMETLRVFGNTNFQFVDCDDGAKGVEWVEQAILRLIDLKKHSYEEERYVEKESSDDTDSRDDTESNDDTDITDQKPPKSEPRSVITRHHYPNLRAIYLSDIEIAYEPMPDSRQIAFQRAIKFGRENGVDVNTHTNPYPPQHASDFPEAPDKFDFKTGPYGGKRPSDRIFNINTGQRKPPACNECGECLDCLELDTLEAWARVEDFEG